MNKFSDRLKEAMQKKNMRPMELARASGLNVGTISHYLSGSYEAKQDKLYMLAEALNVSPTWLMGYDVEMNDNDRLLDAYNRADEKTKKIVRQLLDMEG